MMLLIRIKIVLKAFFSTTVRHDFVQ